MYYFRLFCKKTVMEHSGLNAKVRTINTAVVDKTNILFSTIVKTQLWTGLCSSQMR